jgi:hypothetical protein
MIIRGLNFCNLAPNALICGLRIIKLRLFADGCTCSRDRTVTLWMTLHIQALQGSDPHGTWLIETNERRGTMTTVAYRGSHPCLS